MRVTVSAAPQFAAWCKEDHVTTVAPALHPERTPTSESSMTRHSSGVRPSLLIAVTYGSGWGLWLRTSSPQTANAKACPNPTVAKLAMTTLREALETTACGIPLAESVATTSCTPGRHFRFFSMRQ